MKCQNCGNELAEGVAFCCECGTKVAPPIAFCRECGAKVEAGAKFCPECGASLTVRKEATPEKDKKEKQPKKTKSTKKQTLTEKPPMAEVRKEEPHKPETNKVETSTIKEETVKEEPAREESIKEEPVKEAPAAKTQPEAPKDSVQNEPSQTKTSPPKKQANQKKTSASTSDKLKGKAIEFWQKLDLFCQVALISATVVLVLFLVAVAKHRGLPIIISVLQIAGLIVAFLMHKGYITSQKTWLKYLLLGAVILFALINVMSYSFGGSRSYKSQESKSTAETQAISQPIRKPLKAQKLPKVTEAPEAPIVPERTEKDGFSEENNELVTIGDFAFSVPDYWEADKEKEDEYRAYAERDGKTAMLQIESQKDNFDPVTFDILQEENDNGLMAESMKAWFDASGDVTSESFENGVIKGYIYSCDFEQDDVKGKCQCLVFPSENDNCWIFVSLTESDNTEYTYFGDYRKILESIAVVEPEEESTEEPVTEEETENEAADAEEDPIPDMTEEEEAAMFDKVYDFLDRFESGGDSSNENLTVDNCPDLAAMLSNKADMDPSYASFASKYKGRNIEFDGRIDYCARHGNYKTRFDYLVSAGDYDPDHQTGPSFKFDDVSYSDLHTDIDTVSVGLNVRIVAEVVKYDSNAGLFYLKPVSISAR
ncbi:MAG: DUF4839 domain-containing protein [Lachnospiraceae bacterium]|nr:DUF4839 domain-containing protein [Lachnospiraceae bacterium]